jgi:hypothetical protein
MDLDNKFFFALKETSNQVTKKLPLERRREKEANFCLECVGQWSPS